ncbi:hypothetical protein ACFOLD_12245 [Kocuria carniphila]|uniref:hypothetical protein n=1 Tax=Kocuria carniphila TaxID=262208 RepID=UPI00361F18DC
MTRTSFPGCRGCRRRRAQFGAHRHRTGPPTFNSAAATLERSVAAASSAVL